MEPVIRLVDIYKIYGPEPRHALELVKRGSSRQDLLAKIDHVLALDNISLDVYRGEIFVVMGLSGSGKSTLIRCINRLVEPTAGQVFVDGTEVTTLSKSDLLRLRSQKLGMVFQHFALLPHRNVLDNAAFGLEVQGETRASRNEKARNALKQVGLDGWERRLSTELSGGMQQRVGIARALALNPPILLMDEPFSGLDPLIRKEMQRDLLELQKRLRKTVVFITHDLDEALTLGDRIAILRDGHIEQEGSPQQIVLTPLNDYVAAFVRDVNLLKVLTAESVMRTALTIYRLGDPAQCPLMSEAAPSEEIFIVDSDGQYLGLLSASQLTAAFASGLQVTDSLQGRSTRIHPQDALWNVLADISQPPFVVPVIDDEGRLLGAIDRDSVFAALRR